MRSNLPEIRISVTPARILFYIFLFVSCQNTCKLLDKLALTFFFLLLNSFHNGFQSVSGWSVRLDGSNMCLVVHRKVQVCFCDQYTCSTKPLCLKTFTNKMTKVNRGEGEQSHLIISTTLAGHSSSQCDADWKSVQSNFRSMQLANCSTAL